MNFPKVFPEKTKRGTKHIFALTRENRKTLLKTSQAFFFADITRRKGTVGC